MSLLANKIKAVFSQIGTDLKALKSRILDLENNSGSIVDLDRRVYTNAIGQSTFDCVYTPPYVRVYLDGQKLPGGYTATNGTSITLDTPLASNNQVLEIEAFRVSNETEENTNTVTERRTYRGDAVAGETTFSVNYTPPYVDVFVNGSLIPRDEYVATTGKDITLSQPLTILDAIDIKGMNPYAEVDIYTKAAADDLFVGKSSLGTAAGADLTENKYGNVIGQVIKVGDYGIGGLTIPLSDGQEITYVKGAAFYSIGETTIGLPYSGVVQFGYHAQGYATRIMSQMGYPEPNIEVQVMVPDGGWGPRRAIALKSTTLAGYGITDVKTGAEIYDLNELQISGFYRCNAGSANAPLGALYADLFVSSHADTVAQILVEYATGAMWVRAGIGGVGFTPWRRVAMQNEIAFEIGPNDTMDCAQGNTFFVNMGANRTFNFVNIPNGAYSCILEIYHHGGAITLPAGSVWVTAVPEFSTGKRHLLFFQRTQLGAPGWYVSALPGYPQ